MHIRKLAATFGRLENSTLELDPGLTIIEAQRRRQIYLDRLPPGYVLRAQHPGPHPPGRQTPLSSLERQPHGGPHGSGGRQ